MIVNNLFQPGDFTTGSITVYSICILRNIAFFFLTNMLLLFLQAIYLDSTFCVLKLGGKSSLLRFLAIIGFAIVINTFGFIIVLIHIREVYIMEYCRLIQSNGMQKLGISMDVHNFQLLNRI